VIRLTKWFRAFMLDVTETHVWQESFRFWIGATHEEGQDSCPAMALPSTQGKLHLGGSMMLRGVVWDGRGEAFEKREGDRVDKRGGLSVSPFGCLSYGPPVTGRDPI
jgi:hypothetical protein